MPGPASPFIAYGTIVLFSLVWSSAFIAGKVAVPAFQPFTTLCVRFAISAVLLGLYCRAKGQSLGGRKLVWTGSLLGFVNNVLYLGLTFYALLYISAGWVVIITACSPFMTMGLAALLRLERLSLLKGLGMVVGFSGVVVITGAGSLSSDAYYGIALALLGTLAFSSGTVLFRGKAGSMPIVQLNFWQSISAAVLLVPLVVFEGGPPAPSVAGGLAIGWLVVVSILGMGLWFALIRIWGAGTAASFHLLNPVSGLLLSFVILGLAPGLGDIAGALLVGLGLLITLRDSGNKAEAK